jgi:ectoine hydroxylase-related dioxygenase (phytanoyl-CoA dioxygenase family)
VVLGSHYSGRPAPGDRQPADESRPPSFEGRGPTPVLCRAGDAYLFNHQLWHRGAPNRSGKRRYLMQNQYCQSWLITRFDRGPHRTCDLPPEQAAALDPEARRLLMLNEK